MLTSSEIQAKINDLTRQKNNYEKIISSYRTSLTHANKLIRNLQDSFNSLNSANDYLKRYFTINGNTMDSGKVEKSKIEISKTIKKVNNTIIPSINDNIRDLTRKINLLMQEINNLKRQINTL